MFISRDLYLLTHLWVLFGFFTWFGTCTCCSYIHCRFNNIWRKFEDFWELQNMITLQYFEHNFSYRNNIDARVIGLDYIFFSSKPNMIYYNHTPGSNFMLAKYQSCVEDPKLAWFWQIPPIFSKTRFRFDQICWIFASATKLKLFFCDGVQWI